MSDENIEVRDQRKQGWYWIDNRLVRRDAKVLGAPAIAVYNVLAAYASNDTQEAFPGVRRIAELLGMSKTTVLESIEALKINGWICVTRRMSKDGKQYLSNVYTLVDPPGTAAVLVPLRRKGGTAAGTDQSSLTDQSPVDDRPNIFTVYEQEIGPLTPLLGDQLKDIDKTYPDGWFADAVAVAVENNKRNLGYILAIMRRWKAEGKDSGRKNGKSTDATALRWQAIRVLSGTPYTEADIEATIKAIQGAA